MSLFATIGRDAPEADKLVTLAHLASDFQDKFRSATQKQVNILIYGYLTDVAATDSVKEDIERDLMNRSISSMSKSLVQMGVPIDKLYIGEFVFSSGKARKVDFFLEQQGEARHSLPGNPPTDGHKIPTVNPAKPVRDAELSVNSGKVVSLEMTAFKIESGQRSLVPELSFKSSTNISPVAISNEFGAELVAWKPKLESLLKKIGQQGNADKIEFAVKINAGGKMQKEFAHQISYEIAGQLQVALTFDVTIPGTSHDLPVELSYSYGAVYDKDKGFSSDGQGMIKVTLFRFKKW